MALIQEAYDASHQTYGYRRIQIWIQQNRGVTINHKAVLRLMNKMGIRSVARKSKIYRKLDGYKSFHLYSNILNRDFTASRPNQKWVTDITYIRTQQGWAYLSVMTKTIKQAFEKEKVTDGLILHSDQGQQYSSHPYHVLTNQYSITPSMSRPGNVWDNAVIENFIGHLKEEAIHRIKNPTFNQVKQIIDEYIYFYNYERIQLKTKQTPYQIRCLSG